MRLHPAGSMEPCAPLSRLRLHTDCKTSCNASGHETCVRVNGICCTRCVHYWHVHRFFLQWIAAVVLQFGDDDPQKVYVAPSLKRTCDVLQGFQDPLMATPQMIPAIFFSF